MVFPLLVCSFLSHYLKLGNSKVHDDHNSEIAEYPTRNGSPKTKLMIYQFSWNFLNNQDSE